LGISILSNLFTAQPYLLPLVGFKAGSFACLMSGQLKGLKCRIHPLICPSWNMHSQAYQHGCNDVGNSIARKKLWTTRWC